MNKKFSTLVAGLLLASSVGVYAQLDYSGALTAIDLKADVKGAVTIEKVVNATPDTKPNDGYVKGRAYLLGDANTSLTVVRNSDGTFKLTYAAPALSSLSNIGKSLWILQNIDVTAGPESPKYTFVNKATNVTLSMDKSKAVAYADRDTKGVSALTGEMDWLSASSYKSPTGIDGLKTSPIYVAAANDEVLVLAKTTANDVVLVKMSVTEMQNTTTNADVLMIQPYTVVAANSVYTLSPNDLNTMLGLAGTTASKDSYFQFSFNPSATVKGGENLFAVDLQAVAVDQFEEQYGEANKDKPTTATAIYASLYPQATKSVDASGQRVLHDKYSDRIDPEKNTSYRETASQWVTFKNRDGKYLVVDTAYVDGTSQGENQRISFKFDDLYNARKDSRFRDPRSYLFKVDYNPTTSKIEIISMAYMAKPQSAKTTTAFDEKAWYTAGYATPATNIKSNWYIAGGSDNILAAADNDNYVIKASLGAVTEVTIGEKNPSSEPNNQFGITLGASKDYRLTYMPSGAYVLKIVGSNHKDRIGKYLVDNLVGKTEVMEESQRQNFQHMPAAQWVVVSTGSQVGSPVSIRNREFGNLANNNSLSDVYSSGVLYGVTGQNRQAFFMYGDTLDFIPVEKAGVAELGYKYIGKDTIAESVFTFNYLHDLAMDKPLNTVNDADSLVWVDKDGNAMKFQLERVIDDTYGYNGSLSSVKQLNRAVYYIKVNDASKLQNDRRYLSYNVKSKKYEVRSLVPNIENGRDAYNGTGKDNNAENPTAFFLKENNTVEGAECYYTLVAANLVRVLTSETDHDAKYMVQDMGLNGMYKASWGTYQNIMGQDNTGWKTVAGDKIVDLAYENNETYGANKVSVDNNTLNLVNGYLNDGTNTEVANSAFAVVKDENPLYRRFNKAFEGIASDAPDTVKFFRVNATAKEYLYEDANSVYSKDKGFNFLGSEGKGDSKKASMYVDTAYVNRGTVMPQYLIALAPSVVKADTVICTECGLLNCEHTKITRHSVTARFLVNLQDSVNLNQGAAKAKYQWNKQYTRLGFVDATHIGDSLIIKNSVYTGDKRPMVVGKAATYASNDTINLSGNKHSNVVFEFRLFKTGSNDFLIESESATGIAPEQGGWVKIQNGVPVIAKYNTYKEAGLDAEIFNVEATSEVPTANDAIGTENVSIVAGNGNVTIKNAQGKTVAISNILGQAIAETVITSDNATIAVPAGIVVVSVEGEAAVKAIVR